MEGYDLITSDDKRLGHVVGTTGDSVIVEHGHLRKTRHAIPQTFLDVHEDEGTIRTTLSKQLIEDSPKVPDDGDVDELEIAAYYGLAGGDDTAPANEGYGELNADDPATLNPGIAAAEQERLDVMNHEAGTRTGHRDARSSRPTRTRSAGGSTTSSGMGGAIFPHAPLLLRSPRARFLGLSGRQAALRRRIALALDGEV